MSTRHPWIVLLVLLVFFVISFLTNILGPLVPDIIGGFDLSLALAGFLPFAFFAAYGVMSIPAGMLLERWREKRVLIAAFALAFAGSLLFAARPSYAIALLSLFLIGAGMTLLQVAINPLLRVAGGEEHFAFYSVLGQLVFGLASFLSPFVYSRLVTGLQGPTPPESPLLGALARVVPKELPWVSLYWVFAVVTVAMLALLAFVRLPRFDLKEEERAGGWATHRKLLGDRTVQLYFAAIFCYVGTEQGVANWISKFLADYHGLDPQVAGARAVALFWGLMTAGCLLGLVLLKLADCRRVLIGFTLGAIAALSAALFGPAEFAFYGFVLVGFFISVVWSIVFSLALNSVASHHGSVSGILCTGIVGGAFVSLAVGWLGGRFGLRAGMMLVYLTLGYLLSIGFWAKPLVDNATQTFGELLRSMFGSRRSTGTAVVALCLLPSLVALGGCSGASAPRTSDGASAVSGEASSGAKRHLAAGFRYSEYGPEYNPGAAYWKEVATRMAAKFPGAVPGSVWIVGKLKGEGCELSFPGSSAEALIQFKTSDENEATLDLFDASGFEVWLQVEPGNAPVVELIDLMLARYGHHPSVVGVGVDVEWYRSVDEPEGQAVSDAEAAAWLAAARRHDPELRLFVKHWLIEKLPPTLRDGLVFIDDSQIFPTMEPMIEEFGVWAKAFAPAPVGFQIGYETDRPWWSALADPPAEIGRRILEVAPNTEGLYWVDFTVLELFPPPARAARSATSKDPIVGVKIYEPPEDYAALGAGWKALGVTAVFASEALAGDERFRRFADEQAVPVYLIAPVFQNPEALAREPELAAITADGRAARDDWVAFVCPSRREYRARRVAEIAESVRRLRPRGLSLDFLRHFLFWEKVEIATAHPAIPNACFCSHCLASFAAQSGVTLPAELTTTPAIAGWILEHHAAAWTAFKVGLINSMTDEIVRAARAVDPALPIALHAVPWRTFDYGGAIVRNAGQDLAALSEKVDYLSPMTYAHMLARPPDWVHSVVLRLSESASAPILPSVQVQNAYRSAVPYTVEEFAQGLGEALKAPSAGVVFWSWKGFEDEPEKLRAASALLEARRAEPTPAAPDPSGGTAVSTPPAGLAADRVPLFVTFGFDDNGISGGAGSRTTGGVRWVRELFRGRRNPAGAGRPESYDGAPARFSLYVATRYIAEADVDLPECLKREWRAVADDGHEIGIHTHSHSHGEGFTSAEWAAEIATCLDWIGKPFAAERATAAAVGIGVAPESVTGFRAPYLEYGPALFAALRSAGLDYDCSVEEGGGAGFDGTNFVWPYRVAAGYGDPAAFSATGGTGDTLARELWELPVYDLVAPPDSECARYGVAPGLRERLAARQDYFDPADGKITGFDWNLWVAFAMSPAEVLATLRYSLDLRLRGNRAPFTFGTHSDIYSEQYETLPASTAEERRRALTAFLDYVLSQPEVRVVTGRQLVDWLRQPTAL